jgi:hypothetical protein
MMPTRRINARLAAFNETGLLRLMTDAKNPRNGSDRLGSFHARVE